MTDPKTTVVLNYKEKQGKVRNILSNWKYHRSRLQWENHSSEKPSGSKLAYVLTILRRKKQIINKINKLFHLFLWNGKADKIKQDVMIINNFPAGDLKMIYILSFNKALKATWIKKYLDTGNQGKRKLTFFRS